MGEEGVLLHDIPDHHPKGNVKAITINASVKYDENGRMLYRYGTCQDITRRKGSWMT
ncbi:MAG: hypothetical protein U5L72_17350 [Bacteroidales bacterium]|nr:hypothetical protein [Bacteroidales bacterium]